MTGMDEMPDGRPLTLGGWPGKGVSAGDKGKLLYTQHTSSAAKECKGRGAKKQKQKNTNSFIQKRQLWLFLRLRSRSVQVAALMYHSTPITPSLMYHYTLMLRTIFFSFLSYAGVDFICGAYLRQHLTFPQSRGGGDWLLGGQFSRHCQTQAT